MRKSYSADFKARAALEAIKGQRTLNEIASDLGIHPVMLSDWKRQAVEGMTQVFTKGRKNLESGREEREGQLFQEIGQLKFELDWLKKKSGRIRG